MRAEDLKIKIFADCADIPTIEKLSAHPLVKGFTTNPTLMRKAGVTEYRAFADEVLSIVKDRPVSFEVVADDWTEIERQAHEIASWGENAVVKIPITTTEGTFCGPTFNRLRRAAVAVNVTAITADWQLIRLDKGRDLDVKAPYNLSIFAGRIMDVGFVPGRVPLHLRNYAEVIWASTRYVGCVPAAEELGFDAITLTPDLIAKLPLLGKDLTEYSRETVAMFYADALAAGYTI